MIKVAIQGAASKVAGELIRLLINHPDIELKFLQDCNAKYNSIASVHHGLIGELDMTICDNIQYDEIDVLFLCDSITDEEYKRLEAAEYSELKIVDITGKHRIDCDRFNMIYGLSEMNRKPLVRGATRAVVPSPIASVALISLYPPILSDLIKEGVNLYVSVPKDEQYTVDAIAEIENEIRNELSKIQPDLQLNLNLKVKNDTFCRGIKIKITTDTDTSVDDIVKIYDSVYDDHNLTFICCERLDIKEVEGTDKCLISIVKDDDRMVEIEAIADHYMRGGAGEAVHLMNLLCGLMERTGLMLKTISYY